MNGAPRLERGSLLDLLDEAVTLARAVFPHAFWGLALPPVLGAAVVAALQAGLMSRVLSMDPEQFSPVAMPEWMGRWLAMVLLGLLVAAASLLAFAGMVRAAAQQLEGRTPSAVDGWGWALSWRVQGALLIAGLLVLGGSLLCFLPGIYLMIVYGVMLPAAAVEGLGGYRALERSRSLVLHDPRRRLFRPGMGWVLAVWATGLVLTYGAQLGIQLPLGLAQQMLLMRGMLGQVQPGAEAAGPILPGWFWVLQAATVTLAALVRQLVALYSACAVTLLFFRLRARREGTDVAAALDALGAPE